MIEWIDPSVHEKVRLQETLYVLIMMTTALLLLSLGTLPSSREWNSEKNCAKTIGFSQNTYDRSKGPLGSNRHVY
jgi:hypothetical protein